MRSKNPKDYIIVTKKPAYIFHTTDNMITEGLYDTLRKKHKEETDLTFWLYTKNGELVGRYSVKSAPKWVMNIYDILLSDKEIQYC